MTGDSSQGSGGRKGHTPRLGCVQAECWRPWEVCPRKHAWGLACAKAERDRGGQETAGAQDELNRQPGWRGVERQARPHQATPWRPHELLGWKATKLGMIPVTVQKDPLNG